ncbi:hypothetical protein B0H19DRAFT_1268866 [Mycena capillaripes]|nr:hypothetical protein B0H19DRAFT_1268866 [Mycena capillaripes]
MTQAHQLSTLKQYEKTASEEREAMRTSILPVRFPAKYLRLLKHVVVPSASESQLLPLHWEAINYPEKILITGSATGNDGLDTSQRKDQRWWDTRYCEDSFPDHVMLSPLHVVLARLGAQALVEELAKLEKVARTQLDKGLETAVLHNLSQESISSSKPADRMIDNRYWLSRLADAAADNNSPLVLDYFPTPAIELLQPHGYNKKTRRKYDDVLRPCAAEVSTMFNIFMNVEFTRTDPPPVTSNPLVGASGGVGKFQQAIINADVLMVQPTRLFVPTLSFYGEGEQAKLFLSILNHERLEFAVVDDCFKSDNFPILGYNPLFTYNFSSLPSDFSVGDAIPASVVLPDFGGTVHLNGKRLSQLLRSMPFERSTVVLEGELHEDGKEPIPAVVKRIIVEAPYAYNEGVPAYAPKLVAAFAAHGSPPLTALPVMVCRHLEVMVFASPRGACKLKDVSSATKFLAAAKQLFLGILDAFRRGVMHRDVSANNILFVDNQLLMVDWEIGQQFVERKGSLTGTLNTMVLTQTFVPPSDQQGEWAKILKRYHWDNPSVDPRDLAILRMSLWIKFNFSFTTVNATLQIFHESGHTARAQLVRSLLSIPLLTQRHAVESSDYDAVLSSLQGLVEQAVAAEESVDAVSLARDMGLAEG